MAPFLAFILIIAVDFCRLFYAYNTITNAARNGALWASDPLATAAPSQSPYGAWTTTTNGFYAATLADANNLNPALVPGTYGTITGTYPTTTGTTTMSSTTTPPPPGSMVSVTVQYPFELITSYLGFSSVNLSRTVTMRVAPLTP